jgi:DNA-binding MurR/RpiR family transcriptional regulator
LTDSLLFRAGELVVSANRVFCLPLEAQALPMAEDAQNRLFGLGIASQTVTDPLRQEAVASAAGPGDLFVFFATDGGRSSGKESAESAKRGGGSILALVPGEHELAGIADLLLPMDGLSNRSGERRADEILHAQLLAVTCLESATRNVQQARAAE